MRAGALRKRVTIQQPIEGSRDELGERPVNWGDVTTVWAELLPQSGREFFRASQVRADLTDVVRIRYRPGISARMRLLLNGRVLNLAAPPVNVEDRNRELLLYCVEEG
jgi:SPP1 family predicted phage head-tail adaptor